MRLMGHQHDRRHGRHAGAAHLEERRDADVMRGQYARHFGQNAGRVLHFQVEVEAEFPVLVQRDGRQLYAGIQAQRIFVRRPVQHGVHEVGDDGAGGGHAAGALTVEHQVAHGVPPQEHGVERAPHLGERMAVRQERGPYAHMDPVVLAFGDGQ